MKGGDGTQASRPAGGAPFESPGKHVSTQAEQTEYTREVSLKRISTQKLSPLAL